MEPWYKVVTPRKEVREGRSFDPDEFAIALEQVIAGTAPEDYRKPAMRAGEERVRERATLPAGAPLRRPGSRRGLAPADTGADRPGTRMDGRGTVAASTR